MRYTSSMRSRRRRRRADASARTRLIEEAAQACWAYIVQRELLGLQDADYIRREYAVPAQVWKKMRPKKQTGERGAGEPNDVNDRDFARE